MDKPVLLEVKDLKTYFYSGKHALKAVDSVSFSIREGEVFGLVGRAAAVRASPANPHRAHPPPGTHCGQHPLPRAGACGPLRKALTAVRGKEIGMIFQEPMVALNPVLRIGQQITESFKDPGLSGEEKHARAVELLRRVGIPNPEQRMREYPHQFSGGMRQRVVIAIALASNPKLLLADEPTTALDVTIQAQILQLLRELKDEYGMAMVLVTHNLGVAAQICDRIAVMYGGHIMELGPTRELFAHPQNPYTRSLLASLPVNKRKGEPLSAIPGTPPNLGEMPVGCPFAPRCARAQDVCFSQPPAEREVGPGHTCRCHFADGPCREEDDCGKPQ
ncbi:MAG: ABC transporter ATP-binding protein [Ruthenibacterium lactatiformans]